MYKFQFFLLHFPSRNAISSKQFNKFATTFFFAERYGRWLLHLKISIAQTFWFCNSNAHKFSTIQKMSKSQFSPLHCPSRNAISSKVFNGFSKAFFDWKTRKVAFEVENFNCTEFWFCNSNVTNFPTSGKCKNFNFFPSHCPSRNAISSKVFNEFSKTFFWLKDEDVGYWWLKISMCTDIIGFAIATVQLFQHPENVKISIFAFTLSQQKCYIFKTIYTHSQKLFFSGKIWELAIVLENFNCIDILVLQ